MPFEIKPMVHKWWEKGTYFYADVKPYKKDGFWDKFNVADYARVYLPHNCKNGGCPLHVFLHGCQQATDESLIQLSGLL